MRAIVVVPCLPFFVLALLVAGLTAAEKDDKAIWNPAVRLHTVQSDGAPVGVTLTSGGRALAEMSFGPGKRWKAKRHETTKRGDVASLRFTGFETSGTGGTPKLADNSVIEFVLVGENPFPKVTFSMGFDAFDEEAWKKALDPPAPLYYLTCRVADPKMFYIGGGLMATPEFEPYPLTRQGCMSGNWSARWSYAAPLAAFAVPSFGLWNPDAKLFVGYDFGEARHTDRSGKYIAPAYCAGEGKHEGPAFCLVHPYQANWVDLTYPNGPARVASHFELIHSSDVPSDADPNQFVLTRFFRDHADLLRPVPRMNNLTWIRNPGRVQLPYLITGDHSPLVMHRSGPHYLEGAFVEIDALMLGSTFPADGVRKIYHDKNESAIKTLREQIDYLKEYAIWKEIDGDKCCMWKHPAEGKFKDRWGGEDCAGVYHKSAWQIGTAMMIVYEKEKDKSLLPYIDGVYNWTRHFLYTRNGVCDIPWAMFCHIGLAASENFMLTYRQVFRDDPVRRKDLDEALRLGRMCQYKSIWFYLADPDEVDGMDPIFLGQAVVDCRWMGRVTWNECGWIPRTLIPLYCETGDPFFKYLVRGIAENFFVGYREDGGITENVQIFGEREPKGRRTGGTSGIDNGAQMRRWAEPAGASPVRICVGERAAIAFCKNTFDYDVAEYAYKPELNCTFKLTAREGAKQNPVDVTLTAPFRDLRTREIRINGTAIAKDRIEFNEFTDGEDVYIRGVRPGDRIIVGDPSGAQPAPSDAIPYRELPKEAETMVGRFRAVDIAHKCNERLEMRFGEEGSWYGWIYGLRWRDGIPFHFLDPAINSDRACVKGDPAKPVRIDFAPADHVFAVFGAHGDLVAPPDPIARVHLLKNDGPSQEIEVTEYRKIDVNCEFPLARFHAYLAMLPQAKGLEVLGGRLFAVTSLSRDETLALELRRRFETDVKLALAKAQEGRCLTALRELEEDLPWAEAKASHRIVIDMTPTANMAKPILRIPLDINTLCKQVDAKPIHLPCRLRCVDGVKDVPVQFDLFQDGHGMLTIIPPDDLKAGDAARYVVYLEEGPVRAPKNGIRVDGPSVIVDSGRHGVQFVFGLRAENSGPRLMDIRFDTDGDGKFTEPNVLGTTGFSGGYGCLTAVYDPNFWFNFGSFQKAPATIRVVHHGDASATVVFDGVQLFGCGGPLELTGSKGTFPIGKKGVARWFFRTYTNRPYFDQWVEWTMDDADTSWTRPLQVRYGLANVDPDAGYSGGKPGEVAEAKDLCVVAASEEEQRIVPTVQYTKDGRVIQVLLDESRRVGNYASSFWRMAPASFGAESLKSSLSPVVVEVYALEQKDGDQIIKRKPKAMRGDLVSTLSGPVIPPGPEPPLPGTLNMDSSFEETKQYWQISRDAAWSPKAARTGKVGALLEVRKEKEKKLPLVSTEYRVNREMALEPNTTYKLTFWARCVSEKGQLLTDLYWGKGYDFPGATVDLPGDGKWHHYQVETRTEDFPPPPLPGKVFVEPSRIFPSLRFWCLDMEQVVHLDDACLTPMEKK